MAALATAHSASARSSAEGASASPITVPPPPPAGYDYRAKYCLPDPADDNFPDLVREMIEQVSEVTFSFLCQLCEKHGTLIERETTH
eukprot:SAG31_NODE_1096_length_9920_cov_14.794216_10_plen_87_part_00